MSKIDTSSWEEFKVGDLLGKASLGKYHNASMLHVDENGFPFLCASNFNNGINQQMPRVNGDNIESTPENIIAWGKQCPKFTYHHERCVTNQGIYYYALPNECTEDAARFLCTVLQATCADAGTYNDCLIGERVDSTIIRLPVKDEYEPDWAYMESYMKDVMGEQERQLDSLLKSSSEPKKVDTSKWGNFYIGDLFEKLNLKCRKGNNFNKAVDISAEQTKEFSLPLVNAKHSNNGVMYYGRSDEWDSAEMTIDIVEDGAASAGDVYAQPQRTGVLYNAYLVKPLWNCKSEFVLQYMASVIEKSIKAHFGYENKCTWDKVKSQVIKLPITSSGEPDWQYMEDYMRQVMDRSEQAVENLQSAVTQ